jgi:hypothetical protein
MSEDFEKYLNSIKKPDQPWLQPPDGYFDSLKDRIMEQVDVEEVSDESIAEIEKSFEPLKSVNPEEILKVPNGYFDSQTERLLQIPFLEDNPINSKLEKQLKSLKKPEKIYSVPQDYFQSLDKKILGNRNIEVETRPIITLWKFINKPVVQLVAATVVLLFGFYFGMDLEVKDQYSQASVNKTLKEFENATFTQTEVEDYFTDEELIVSAFNNSNISVDKEIDDLENSFLDGIDMDLLMQEL